MYLKFPNPINTDKSVIFKDGFFCGQDYKKKILEYNNNFDGWSEDLTKLHEGSSEDGNHPIDKYSRENTLDLLGKSTENENILEIGCASGWLLRDLLEKNSQINYYGADVLKITLNKLSEKHPNIPFIIFDINQNPLKNIEFDNIIILNVLEHIKDDEKAIYEISKLVKKNGKLILEVPAHNFLFDSYDRELMHFRRYSLKRIVNLLEKNKFKIQKKIYLGSLIFVPFAIVKFFNKIFKKKKRVVADEIKYSNNLIVKILINLEKKLKKFSLPFGIRISVVAKKV